jgi:hypothetical protein
LLDWCPGKKGDVVVKVLMDQIYSQLHKYIQDAFNEYGVQIMSPAYVSDPDRQKVVPRERWYAPPAKPPDDLEKKG